MKFHAIKIKQFVKMRFPTRSDNWNKRKLTGINVIYCK